jgi:hypothetical protein
MTMENSRLVCTQTLSVEMPFRERERGREGGEVESREFFLSLFAMRVHRRTSIKNGNVINFAIQQACVHVITKEKESLFFFETNMKKKHNNNGWF